MIAFAFSSIDHVASFAEHLWNLYFGEIALQREKTPSWLSCLWEALQSGAYNTNWLQSKPELGLSPNLATPALDIKLIFLFSCILK